MNLTAYINSGELELYVLDRLSPDERRRVEEYATEYPEVKEEINEIERSLEEYALLAGQATPPPPAVLTTALAAIAAPSVAASSTDPAPASPPPAPRTAPPSTTGSTAVTWILATLLLLALAGLAYFFLQARNNQNDTSELRQRFTTLEEDCERIRDNAQQNSRQVALLSDIETRGVILEGSDNAPESRAVVFYNTDAGEVLFSAANLPAPPSGKQYQLWAIDAAGPQDLGVLSRNLTGDELLDVRFVPETQAFAITLEDDGGKPTPDLSQLQVIGNVGP